MKMKPITHAEIPIAAVVQAGDVPDGLGTSFIRRGRLASVTLVVSYVLLLIALPPR